MKNNKSNTQNATKTTKTTFSLKKCVFVFKSQFLRIHIGRKGWGSYIKIIGVWGRVYGVLIPGIALVAGPHRPKNSAKKIFLHRFRLSKMRSFLLFQKSIFCYIVAGIMIFGRKLVFWTPKSPQKVHIDHVTQFCHIFEKAKKIVFWTIKIDEKNFSWPNFPDDVDWPQKQYQGSIHPTRAPKSL